MDISKEEGEKVARLYNTVETHRKMMTETKDPCAWCNLYLVEVEACNELWQMGIPVVGYAPVINA